MSDFIDESLDDSVLFRIMESNHLTIEYIGETWEIWKDKQLLSINDDLRLAIYQAIKGPQ